MLSGCSTTYAINLYKCVEISNYFLTLRCQKSATSLGSYSGVENMGSVDGRNNISSKGIYALASFYGYHNQNSIHTINLGSNPVSLLEVVSSLNSFNLGHFHFHHYIRISPEKFNLKVYLGAVYSVSHQWNYDDNSGLKSDQKSGSCSQS